MKISGHTVFILFLIFIGLLATVSLAIHGWEYYTTPVSERAFRDDYASMKPSGTYSHGLGIIGSAMIIIGVSTYSTRKRMRALSNLGKLSYWLEFHIFLCLIGPILVIYHTTFKAGGIAAITLWTMTSVALSGIIGRFLYVQIPRNIDGSALTLDEINSELSGAKEKLITTPMGLQAAALIDNAFAQIAKPSTLTSTVSTLLQVERIARATRKNLNTLLRHNSAAHDTIRQVHTLASSRMSLLRRTLFLSSMEKLFYYWHAVHLPFSIIMFVTLAAHVTVSFFLGYHWVF